MSDIADWLTALGLDRYTQAFIDNGIDQDVLADLNDGDLQSLGVVLGHRKKMLRAIAWLDRHAPETSAQVPPQAEGERRPVTVLFADISGYTRRSAGMDPEDTHALLNRYFGQVDAVVHRYGGTVDKHIGDAVMAVFGAPVAHSDDPERAVRAALGIHQAVATLEPPLAVHVGIASGRVVASGTGSAGHPEYTVTGDTVNLAARLQDLAEPQETLVSQAVYRAVERIATAEPLGDVAIKGLDRPIAAWRLIDIAIDGAAGRGHRLVGRRSELRQFESALAEAIESRLGSLVLLHGEAGIGKSRLLDEFRGLGSERGFECHSGQVLDFAGQGEDAAATIVRSLLGLPRGCDEAARAAALERGLERGLGRAKQRVFLNDLLELPQPTALRALYDAMDNETRDQGLRETITELVRGANAHKPLLLAVEDLHWADTATLAQLAAIAAAVTDEPAILVMTTRTDGDPLDQTWRTAAAGAVLTTIDLAPLRAAEAEELAREYTGSSAAFAKSCVARAEGNPLFLDQLLRSAPDSQDQDSHDRALPGTIQSVVLARVDRLAPQGKAALQAAAAIGQRFTADALRHVLDDQAFDCGGLVTRLLIRPEGDAYLFAHSLIREGVYDALMTNRRRALHRRAAAWFAGRDPVLRAEHLERAADAAAPGAYHAAAEAQLQRHHGDRAIQLAERGLALAAETADRWALTMLLGDLRRSGGAPREAIAMHREALSLAATDLEKCRAWIGIAAGVRLSGEYDEGIEALNQAEAHAHGDAVDRERAQIHYYRGTFFFSAGDIDGCLSEQERALTHALAAKDAMWEARVLGGLGDAYYARCRMVTALDYLRRCVALSHDHGFGRIEVANRFMVGTNLRYMNDLAGALAEVQAAAALARDAKIPRILLYALACEGEFMIERGESERATVPLAEALSTARALGNRRFQPYVMMHQARGLLAAGNAGAAASLLDEALAICRETDPRFIAPRVLGLVALAAGADKTRRGALAEGEAVLARGCNAHNHLWFYRDAIDACLGAGDWDAAERYAAALAAYTAAEPLPWSDFIVARGRALAAQGSGNADAEVAAELTRLRDDARRIGHGLAQAALDAALAARL